MRTTTCVIGLAAVMAAFAANAFTSAPLGAIRPKGWLFDRARAARDGYTGHMDGVSHHFRRAWSADWKPRGVYLNWGNDEKDCQGDRPFMPPVLAQTYPQYITGVGSLQATNPGAVIIFR